VNPVLRYITDKLEEEGGDKDTYDKGNEGTNQDTWVLN